MIDINSLDIRNNDLDVVEEGTRFAAGTNVVTYAGEKDLDYVVSSEDDESEFQFEHNGTTFKLSEFERTDGYRNFGWFDGVHFGTVESGWLVKLTSDGEGLFLFTF